MFYMIHSIIPSIVFFTSSEAGGRRGARRGVAPRHAGAGRLGGSLHRAIAADVQGDPPRGAQGGFCGGLLLVFVRAPKKKIKIDDLPWIII
jgi:hypothetical protein